MNSYTRLSCLDRKKNITTASNYGRISIFIIIYLLRYPLQHITRLLLRTPDTHTHTHTFTTKKNSNKRFGFSMIDTNTNKHKKRIRHKKIYRTLSQVLSRI